MTSKDKRMLYREVVDLTKSYLGPAAERFIARQIKAHLNKEPDELSPADLARLADWIKVAIALLTEDSKIVQDYTDSLLKLAQKR